MITAALLSLSLGRLMAPNVSMLVSEQLISVERKGSNPAACPELQASRCGPRKIQHRSEVAP